MLKIRVMTGIALLAATVGTAPPASALALRTSSGVSGGMTVSADFTVCVTLTFSGGRLFAGQLSAVGELQGPGTQVGTVRGAIPILASGTWSGCIPGAYFGATVGDGKFVLDAHAATDDYVEVKQCVVNFGALTCV